MTRQHEYKVSGGLKLCMADGDACPFFSRVQLQKECAAACAKEAPFHMDSGECLRQCPVAFNDTTKLCITDLSRCIVGEIIQLNASVAIYNCTTRCDLGFVKNISFTQCVNSCPSSYPIQFNGQCKRSCPNGLLLDTQSSKCVANCASHQYRQQTQQVSLGEVYDKCVEACEIGSVAVGNTCVFRRCPTFYYQKELSDSRLILMCFNGGCIDGYVLFGEYQCLIECPDGYQMTSARICQAKAGKNIKLIIIIAGAGALIVLCAVVGLIIHSVKSKRAKMGKRGKHHKHHGDIEQKNKSKTPRKVLLYSQDNGSHGSKITSSKSASRGSRLSDTKLAESTPTISTEERLESTAAKAAQRSPRIQSENVWNVDDQDVVWGRNPSQRYAENGGLSPPRLNEHNDVVDLATESQMTQKRHDETIRFNAEMLERYRTGLKLPRPSERQPTKLQDGFVVLQSDAAYIKQKEREFLERQFPAPLTPQQVHLSPGGGAGASGSRKPTPGPISNAAALRLQMVKQRSKEGGAKELRYI